MPETSRMPTAAKLVSAILFAALGYLASELVKEILPQQGGVGLLSQVNAALCAVMGWRVMGARAGDGYVPAVGYGLTTVFAMIFWCILIWAAYEMTRRATRGRYDGPGDALGGMGDLMVDYAALVISPTVIGTLLLGGIICGMISEYISHRWP